ncbi:AdoMet_MTases domain containing protein [uncultured Caudovirales phage]|uniref:AdoMet_MTases domain containing protein n=1 Tax=uncultured Caudovirales phage TaxID=2100421 RepID=A0A6J5KNY2_9CAUD|nr:AdoMet_MTases domain containing protein [uncultured Caudovirales phage]
MKKKVTKKQDQILALDLGCGQNKVNIEFFTNNLQITPTEVVGIDFAKCEGVDIIHDLTNFPYPIENESVDAIFSSHFVEHLDGFERMKFFDECYRILKKGGKMRLVHPYYKSVRAIQDPTHKFPPISENSYLYWDKNWRIANKLDHYPLTCDFEFSIFYSWQDGTIANKNEETRNFSIDKYWNIVADLIVDLKKR